MRATRRQSQRWRAGAIGHPHDIRTRTAVLEELLHGIREGRWLPQTAEELLELREARYEDRPADRPLQGAADKSGNAGRHAVDRVVRPTLLQNFDAGDAAHAHGCLFVVVFLERRALERRR